MLDAPPPVVLLHASSVAAAFLCQHPSTAEKDVKPLADLDSATYYNETIPVFAIYFFAIPQSPDSAVAAE